MTLRRLGNAQFLCWRFYTGLFPPTRQPKKEETQEKAEEVTQAKAEALPLAVRVLWVFMPGAMAIGSMLFLRGMAHETYLFCSEVAFACLARRSLRLLLLPLLLYYFQA